MNPELISFKIAVFLLSLCLGCTPKERIEAPISGDGVSATEQIEETDEKAGRASVSKPSPKDHLCEPLKMSNPESLAVWPMKNGTTLVVCSLNTYFTPDVDHFTGWINIYEKRNNELISFLKDVNSELPSEFFTYSIKKVDNQKVLITRLIRPMSEEAGDVETPATEMTLECAKAKCTLSNEKCIAFDKKVDHEAIQFVEKVSQGKAEIDEMGYYDVVIGKLIDSAIAGDKKALKLALSDSIKLRTDGAASEVLTSGQYLLKQLLKLKCIKQ